MPYGGGGYRGGGGGRGGGRDDNFTTDLNAEQFRKLFIGGLSYDTDEKGLREHFETWGEIVDCVVIRDPSTKRSRGFGFITYKDLDGIDQAQANRPHTIGGREVETKRAMPRDEPHSQQTVKKMFVGGMKDDTQEDHVRELFSEFGDIEQVEMITDKGTGKTRGFCFVTFKDYDAVDKCVLMKRHKLNSRNVEVKKAVSKQDLNKGGGGGPSGGRGDFGGYGGSGGGGYGGGGGYSQGSGEPLSSHQDLSCARMVTEEGAMGVVREVAIVAVVMEVVVEAAMVEAAMEEAAEVATEVVAAMVVEAKVVGGTAGVAALVRTTREATAGGPSEGDQGGTPAEDPAPMVEVTAVVVAAAVVVVVTVEVVAMAVVAAAAMGEVAMGVAELRPPPTMAAVICFRWRDGEAESICTART